MSKKAEHIKLNLLPLISDPKAAIIDVFLMFNKDDQSDSLLLLIRFEVKRVLAHAI